MKLAIISHTEHYTTEDGTIVGLSSTVNEINHLLSIFDTIYHVAMLHNTDAPANTMSYTSDQVLFVPIPTVGGKGFKNKLHILAKAPQTVRIIAKVLKDVDYFQFRAPTGIGVYMIPYLSFFVNGKGWYKYAGNWNQTLPPLGYRLQRWFLKHQSRKVTINGMWQDQPQHCLSFENPCLTDDDISYGRQLCAHKSWPEKLSFCFVGRLETEKGVALIIKAFELLSENEKAKIETLHFIGNGKAHDYLKAKSKGLGIHVVFHGLLSQQAVFEVYQQCHFLLLPSKAEGFPKVVAEAMNFCCIPLVSKVSSIGQYVRHLEQGFLIDPITINSLTKALVYTLNLNQDDYLRLIKNQRAVVTKFTFSNYNHQLQQRILKTF